MVKAKRFFFVADVKSRSDTLLIPGPDTPTKGYRKCGCDTRVFNFRAAFQQAGFILSRKCARRLCKSYVVDKLLVKHLKDYNPDVVCIDFANYLDAETITQIRQAVPNAFLIGIDGDPWPQYQKNRLEAAAKLDLVAATFAGNWLKSYEDAGVRCVFMPNKCDPDIHHRYEVADKWENDIIFTGQAKFKRKRYPTDNMRYQLISCLKEMKNSAIYGCLGRPKIGGLDYLHAISGAKIGLSVNVINDVSMFHSDRLTHYLACGTFVLAKRVPDSESLFKDGVHLRYFDTAEEFFNLANYYLKHEDERLKIANAGMQWAHTEFNCETIARYTMELIENGSYSAPWIS